MSAPFLTAEQLGITAPEYNGLRWVLENLRNGTIKERPVKLEEPGEGMFLDMGTEFSEPACGTVACIGGWVAATMGFDIPEAVRYVDRMMDYPDSPLYKLYWDEIGMGVRPSHALAAIENLLRTGNPDWDSVMGRTNC